MDRMMFLPAARIVRAGLPVPKRIGAKLQAAQEWRRFDAGTLKSLVLLGEPGEPSKSRPKIKIKFAFALAEFDKKIALKHNDFTHKEVTA